MTARNILFATEPTVPLEAVAGSGFTHLYLGSCHLEQNPALQVFRILNGPVSDITPLFRAPSGFQEWVTPLDGGVFPPGLRQASAAAFAAAGQPALSDGVTVAVNTPGSSWTLTDPASGNSYPMQLDPKGTFISFNGAPLAVVNDGATVTSYTAALNAGQFPAGLQQTAGLEGPNASYTVTQVAAQITGSPQWLITDTTTGFSWFVAIGTQGSPTAMVMRNYQDFFSANLAAFMQSLGAVSAAGIPIFLSFGGWADFQTWAVMGENVQQALVVAAEVLELLGPLSGVDYDWEQLGQPGDDAAADIQAMTQFTQGLQAGRPGTPCTICPYAPMVPTLLQVWQNVGFANIAWMNCMNYSPANNSPYDIASDFVDPAASAFGMQFSDVAPYAVAGFTANHKRGGKVVYFTPGEFAHKIGQVVQGDPPSAPAIPNLGGAFTYGFDFGASDLASALEAWASAVAGALEGATQFAAAAA